MQSIYLMSTDSTVYFHHSPPSPPTLPFQSHNGGWCESQMLQEVISVVLFIYSCIYSTKLSQQYVSPDVQSKIKLAVLYKNEKKKTNHQKWLLHGEPMK